MVVDSHVGNDGAAGTGLTGNVKTGQAAALGREGPTGGNYFTGFVDDLAIWKRALTPAEVGRLFNEGQNGQSLGDLLRQPTSLIEFVSVQKDATAGTLEIHFRNLGPWQTFRLLRAASVNGGFEAVPGMAPAALGGGEYRFSYLLNTNAIEFFRVEGW